jgi:D-3-phosphoglycerate dehydrogenase
MTYQIKILNNISPLGLEKFDKQKYQVASDCSQPDALLVRSADMLSLDIPDSVQVVGRAGVGVNNIPLQKLTARGIPVLNTPGANANAVKELVITAMLLVSRNICPAWDYTRQLSGDDDSLNQRIEHEKKQFAGFELPGKTLGVIGLGKIGVKVANAAIHLGMKVIGYDPSVTVSSAWELSSSVQQADSIKNVFKNADFITLHVPLNEHTHHFINAKNIVLMKPGVVILNFARPNIVDNQAVAAALQANHLRNYVCDFPSNIFKHDPRVICLPHLGASTQEAEENCAMMIVDQVIDYLEHGNIQNAVNFPAVKLERTEGYRLVIANANIPNMVAQISSVLSQAKINIIDMINKSKDDIAYTMIDVNAPITQNLLNQIRAINGVIRARQL